MSKQLTFYTVCMRKGYPVKYIKPDDGYIPHLFSLHQSADPGEASQEFKAWLGPAHQYCHLESDAFTEKVVAFTKQRKAKEVELAKWRAMAGGKG